MPAAWKKHRSALDEFVACYPALFDDSSRNRDYNAVGGTFGQRDSAIFVVNSLV